MSSQSEQRRCQRYRPRHATFAVISHPNPILGKVINIHHHGLCLECVDLGMDSRHAARIDLICSNSRTFISDLPCRVVYDSAPQTPPVPFSTVGIRYIGLELAKLNPGQEKQLARLLDQCQLPLAANDHLPVT